MKTIGLVGGISWESTREYYRIINEGVKKELGGLHSAKIVMCSLDFEELVTLAKRRAWQESAVIFVDAMKRLERAGADFALLCANTPHKLFDDVQKEVRIPLLNIVDATAKSIQALGLTKVGLLGTIFTMEDGFYQRRMKQYSLEVMVPEKNDRDVVHRTIFDELCLGNFSDSSRKRMLTIMEELKKNGAQGVILGCTEIPLLIQQRDVDIPLFDTTRIHAEAAMQYALAS